MTHANGCSGLSELVVVTGEIEADASLYAKAAQAQAEKRDGEIWTIDLAGGFRLTLMSPARYLERYGERSVDGNGRHSFFGAVVFKAADLDSARGFAASIPELRVSASANSLVLLVPFLNTLLEFRSDR
jgi:hypothetical protein